MVLVGNQYSERRAGRGAKEFVYDLRGQDKGDIVWVDGDARTVSLKEPLCVAFFNDGSGSRGVAGARQRWKAKFGRMPGGGPWEMRGKIHAG